VSKHRGSHQIVVSRAELALEDLCTELGYCDCLYPPAKEAILANPPPDAEAFVDAVLLAEERDPTYVLKQDRRPMLEIVDKREVYGSDYDRGSGSTRPRFPA
jgi:hypothetical protein